MDPKGAGAMIHKRRNAAAHKGDPRGGTAPACVTPPYKRVALLRTARSVLIFVAAGLAVAGCSTLPDALDMSATGSLGGDAVAARAMAPPSPPVSPRPAVAIAAGKPVVQAVAYTAEPVPKGIAPDDWAAARQALAEALREKNASPSVPWENYANAARGTAIPLGVSRQTQTGTCRDFRISFVRASDEKWLQGEACRSSHGSWQVAQARLLARS